MCARQRCAPRRWASQRGRPSPVAVCCQPVSAESRVATSEQRARRASAARRAQRWPNRIRSPGSKLRGAGAGAAQGRAHHWVAAARAEHARTWSLAANHTTSSSATHKAGGSRVASLGVRALLSFGSRVFFVAALASPRVAVPLRRSSPRPIWTARGLQRPAWREAQPVSLHPKSRLSRAWSSSASTLPVRASCERKSVTTPVQFVLFLPYLPEPCPKHENSSADEDDMGRSQGHGVGDGRCPL